MEGALKVKNYPLIAGFLFGNLWLLHAIIFGRAPDIGWMKDLSTAIPSGVAATILGVAMNELMRGEFKARFLFMRWTNPLPGTRAFTEFAPGDPRIDLMVLTKRFGKPDLPTAPEDQNKLWYRIMKANESRPSVAYAHQYYLLMRDLTFVTGILAVATLIVLALTRSASGIWLVAMGFVAGELALSVRAGRSLAHEFVCNALAEESAKIDKVQ